MSLHILVSYKNRTQGTFTTNHALIKIFSSLFYFIYINERPDSNETYCVFPTSN